MGCAISKAHKITDSSLLGQNTQPIQVVRSAQALTSFFSDEQSASKPKCVFIFGGSGSNKGEFIWELIREHDAQADEKYTFCYIDVQFLIANNIKERVLLLSDTNCSIDMDVESNGPEVEDVEQVIENDPSADESAQEVKSEDEEELIEEYGENNIQVEQVKPLLTEFANVVTCTWVLSLVEKEINERSAICPNIEMIFIVNLLPSRINLFKNCLYLKQIPNFSGCNVNYVAINLIKHDCTKKDLDLDNTSSAYDDANVNFLNYFRNLNKLVDLKIQPDRTEQLTIKLTRAKNAKKVKNPQELMDILRTDLKNEIIELDIRDYSPPGKLKRGDNLLFFVDNQIDINEGEILLLVDPSENNLDAVRHFAQTILKAKKSLDPPVVLPP